MIVVSLLIVGAVQISNLAEKPISVSQEQIVATQQQFAGAERGDLVVFEVTAWSEVPVGRYARVIGKAGDGIMFASSFPIWILPLSAKELAESGARLVKCCDSPEFVFAAREYFKGH